MAHCRPGKHQIVAYSLIQCEEDLICHSCVPLEDVKELSVCLSQLCVLVERTACLGPGAYFGQVGGGTWELDLASVTCFVHLTDAATAQQHQQLRQCKCRCCC